MHMKSIGKRRLAAVILFLFLAAVAFGQTVDLTVLATSDIHNNYLNYETGTDYGIEVNRKLYWYFKYLESEFKIPLLR